MSSEKGKEPVDNGDNELVPYDDSDSKKDQILTEVTEDRELEIEFSDYEKRFLEMFKGYKCDYPISLLNNEGEEFEFPIFIVAKISPLAEMILDLGEIPDDPLPFPIIDKEFHDTIINFYNLETNTERQSFVQNLIKALDKITVALKEKKFPTKDEYCDYAREVCLEVQDIINKIDFCHFGGKGDTDFMLLSKHSYWDINDEPLMGIYKVICLKLSKLVEEIFDEALKPKFFEDPEDKLTFTFSKGEIVDKKITEEKAKEIKEDNADGAPFIEILEGIDDQGNTYKYIKSEEPTGEYYVDDEYEPKNHDFPVQLLRSLFGQPHEFTKNRYLEELRINDILEGKIKE